MIELERRMRAYEELDEESLVGLRLLDLVCNALVEGHELELDQDTVRRRTSRRSVCMVDLVREAVARRGLSLGELDAGMGWPEGQTERIFAEPLKASHEDVRRLGEMLGIPMTRIFELRAPGEEAWP